MARCGDENDFSMSSPQIQILPDPKAIAEEAARRIAAAAQAKLADGSQFFSLVLSGGSTPKILYEMLAAEPYRSKLNWAKVEIYFGDERCVQLDVELVDVVAAGRRLGRHAVGIAGNDNRVGRVAAAQIAVFVTRGEIERIASRT